MTQPTIDDGPPVPLMVEGWIDAATLGRLFDDLAAAATVIAIREKGGPQTHAGSGGLSPRNARDQLLSGTARAVQIRYHFDGHEWTDTVLALPSGYRVVRCRHDDGNGANPS